MKEAVEVMSFDDKTQVVEKYGNLVRRVARHIKSYLPVSILLEDLVQAGMIGLLDAAKNFDTEKGVKFETFAGIRVRGAMIDEVRKGDWAPRSVHRKAREVAAAQRKVENKKGRDAKGSEIAKELGITLDEFHDIICDAKVCQICNFDEPKVSSGLTRQRVTSFIPGPLENAERDDYQTQVRSAVDKLSERERLVISLYYNEELNLKNIGEILGVSESRVSQIHSSAVNHLYTRIGDKLV